MTKHRAATSLVCQLICCNPVIKHAILTWHLVNGNGSWQVQVITLRNKNIMTSSPFVSKFECHPIVKHFLAFELRFAHGNTWNRRVPLWNCVAWQSVTHHYISMSLWGNICHLFLHLSDIQTELPAARSEIGNINFMIGVFQLTLSATHSWKWTMFPRVYEKLYQRCTYLGPHFFC